MGAIFNTNWVNVIPGLTNQTLSFSNSRLGWVTGVGAETMLWGNWSLKSEVLYMQFNEESVTALAPAPFNANFGFVHNDSAWVSRTALTYGSESAFRASQLKNRPVHCTGRA